MRVYHRQMLGDASTDAFANALTNFSVMGMHPVTPDQASDMAKQLGDYVRAQARSGVIPYLVAGGVITYLLLRRKAK